MHVLLSLKTQDAPIAPKYFLLFHALRPLLTVWLGLVHPLLTVFFDSKLTTFKLTPTIGSPLYPETGPQALYHSGLQTKLPVSF